MAFNKYDSDGNLIKGVSTPLDSFEESITEQHHELETDINKIIARNGLELRQDVNILQNLRFDDVQNNDFQEMMNMLITGREAFASLPSDIRKYFDNDPAQFLDFVNNPDSHDQLVEWGLADAKESAPGPQKVVMVDENGDLIPAAEAPAP